jgi:hypothetical protein
MDDAAYNISNNILTPAYHVWGTPSPLVTGYKGPCARKWKQQSMKLAAQVLWVLRLSTSTLSCGFWHCVILFVNTEAEREVALTASIFMDNHVEGSTM